MPNPAGRQDMCIVNPGIGAFGDDIGWRQRGAQSSREDVPMPDYASTSSTSSRVLSSMTGLSYEHSKQPSVASGLGDDHYELIENPTPTKAPLGTRAPSGADMKSAGSRATMAALPNKSACSAMPCASAYARA
ncbi:hypothetical protein N7535_003103 [Penicillium sp. DV-2018c]|nr:hypothetical protein N7535_003103 [Penicillium sp. DV-2018c]